MSDNEIEVDVEEVEEEENATYLPVLYGEDAKGKERFWKVWVVGNTVHRSAGMVGKKAVPSEKSFFGKNKGKKNETTDEEQALLEAERSWVKQLDKAYLPKCKEGKALLKKVSAQKGAAGGTNHGLNSVMGSGKAKPAAAKKAPSKAAAKKAASRANNLVQPSLEADILPMHCQAWVNEAKCLKHFDFNEGVYAQTKLDGVRAIVRLQSSTSDDGSQVVVMTSRKGKQFPWLKHIRDEVMTFLEGYESIVLDGELYVHHLYDVNGEEVSTEGKFPMIAGAVSLKRSSPHPQEGQLELHVFDILDTEKTQDERFEVLKEMFERPDIDEACPRVKLVETRTIDFPEEIVELCDEFAQEDYEGVIVRARDLMYKEKGKSLKMRKYKEFIDAEFTIVDLEWDEGVGREHFTFVCEMEDGSRFNAKPRGTREQKYEWHDAWDEDSDSMIGKPLTVRYQQPSEDGIPRFPRAIAIRDYE